MIRQFKYLTKLSEKNLSVLLLIVTNKSSLALKKKKPTKECRNKKDNTKSIFKIDCVQDQDYSNHDSHRCVRCTEFD